MPDPTVGHQPEDQPRLDLHNTNVEHIAAEVGQCATIDLRSGRVCQLPSQHPDGCDFQPPDAPSTTGRTVATPL